MSGDDYSVTVEWVQEQLRDLQRNADDIWGVRPDIANSFKEWSTIKLIILAGVVDLYTTIIPKHFDNFFYIDAMSGSGSVVIEEHEERFVGSPILTSALAHEPFNHMYLIEFDSERAQALRQRMEFVSSELDYGVDGNFTVIEGDANEEIPELVDNEIQDAILDSGSVHTLSFVDNEGADIEWSTIEKLTTVYSDLVVNFPSNNIQRMAGVLNATALNEFYGNSRWRGAGTDSMELLTIYKGGLSEVGRDMQEAIRVHGSRNFHYDVIYATRETANGSPYMTAFEWMQDKLEDLDGDDIDRVLRYMRGEAVDFNPFPGPDPDQTGLGDFL